MGATMMGARVKRLEDPRLLRGQASFVDDLRLPGVLHAAILRSSHAHARIRKIDLSAKLVRLSWDRLRRLGQALPAIRDSP